MTSVPPPQNRCIRVQQMGEEGAFHPKTPPEKLTYDADPPMAALIITEALFAAACNVAELKWE